MNCPYCGSTEIRKNGWRRGKQNHICTNCDRQFIDVYSPPKGYSDEKKIECLKAYVNGAGFRAIERQTGVQTLADSLTLRYHTTIINWVKQIGEKLPEAPLTDKTPSVGELDELETFVPVKKNKIWIWTALDHFNRGILAWVVGDHSAETFKPLWNIVSFWGCYFYVTDGWRVYASFINPGDHIISKTYMTRVEGENTRLRHYLARLHRKTLCYSKSVDMLKLSIKLLLHYLKYGQIPVFS
ncbi:IS1 family transposase [Nostoc sp. ChiVER01]|uniref:IS1 family transposase n=1 Tax=Nostoc sp. ChiVER01 TaxID=3075382 RepID=UPI002AD54C8A|nr:IS1 family transposase [Nostoc sp. ChiVER01]MDZ8228086.1 IS1 family transposase [Nostoc sp. ChiVER01]